ncbi:glyoxylate/hydroxypyruvate reductase A-like [Microplitis mediator]|uniref:glyoxylate/hydroxypyruvate reductase A-like n=1 Tax=Microplitis mediator TaxID=375433 RepID=UPI0025557BB0|nr:glyoxylate/hydroxypyruvate reductase A-like [Microplitis mediator]
MNHVIVYSSLSKLAQHIKKLMPLLNVININPDNSEPVELNNAEIMVADCSLLPNIKHKLSNIKWIQSTFAGVEKLMELRDDKNINFIVTRFVDDTFGIEMAEYVVMQIVAHERKQWDEYEAQKKTIWASDSLFGTRRLISDMNIGIMGVGNIGKPVARILKNFGAKIRGLTRTVPTIKESYIDEYRTTNLLPEFLSNCDYVINILPATPETDGLLNGDVLKNCKENNTIFINVGRGNIIKENDLVTALENKWIAAAILDVFEVEPLPPTSKLWTMPQVIITPHNSCSARTESVAKLFVNNYKKFINGEPLPNTVDFQRGY